MKINEYIDHTILNQDATKDQVIEKCNEAKEYGFKSVCVNSSYTKLVSEELKDSDVLTCSTIAFPLGCGSTESKVKEAEQAILDGSDEIDMVINVGRLKDKDYDYVENEIRLIKEACGDKTLKVIIETCLLTDEEKVKACELAVNANADFVKTSTGFSTGGATVEDVKLMKDTVGIKTQVKASGGIKTLAECLEYIENGASRIGASRAIEFVKEQEENE